MLSLPNKRTRPSPVLDRMSRGVFYFLLTWLAIYCGMHLDLTFLTGSSDGSMREKSENEKLTAHAVERNEATGRWMKEMEEASGNERGGPCQQKTKLVYIKTHKTGSCTTTSIIYRFALKYDVPTLQLKAFPYPGKGLHKFFIHTHRFLQLKGKRLTRRFHIAADHMRYERDEFDQVMEGPVFYTTTLRRPPEHLRSVFSYFDLQKKLEIPSSVTDAVEEYILNRSKYPQSITRLENRNADMLGFNTQFADDSTKVKEFIDKIEREFGLVMITEYSLESYIVLRRRLCWQLVDILFHPLNFRKYVNKNIGLSPEALKAHQQWNNVDYALYNHFNASLWKQIEKYGDEFWTELNLYRKYLVEIKAYCDPLANQIFRNWSAVGAMTKILHHVKPLHYPETAYGRAFDIDVVWCTLTRINMMEFYNIMRVKQFPALCDFLMPGSDHVEPNKFGLNDNLMNVKLWSGFCAPKTNNTLVAVETLARTYEWWNRKLQQRF